ncbi:MAG: hypothetical protein Q9160_005672 [Pyrenula sp. 1 TL-2023]
MSAQDQSPRLREKRSRSVSRSPQEQKRRRLLSPPSSGTPKKDRSEDLPHLGSTTSSLPPSGAKNSKSSVIVETSDQECTCQSQRHKKRAVDNENPVAHIHHSAFERGKTTDASTISPTHRQCECRDADDYLSIDHWAKTGLWPIGFGKMRRSQERSISPKKRQRTPSYTQSVKDGKVPQAHTPAFENELAKHGIIMDEQKGRSLIADSSKTLCETLLAADFDEPEYTSYPSSRFIFAWERARKRNESRIFRDVTARLLPSAELLFICGHEDLEHIAEEIIVEWNKSKTLGGPKPKPDFAVGISPTAFTEEELLKIENNTSFERPTLFTDNVYFPFLLCEVKCGDQAINRADRQNMHSGSMAVNAIIQLYQSLGDQKATQLSGKVLVFSISHDNERVKIYGHYAIVQEGRITFLRYLIESFIFNIPGGQGRKRTYDFVREIYQTFYPQHLKRVQDALKELAVPHIQSDISIVTSDSQSVFRIPDQAASQIHRAEIALLQEQLANQERQNRENMERLERLYKEQMAQQEKQMAQQERQYKEQIEIFKQLLKR